MLWVKEHLSYLSSINYSWPKIICSPLVSIFHKLQKHRKLSWGKKLQNIEKQANDIQPMRRSSHSINVYFNLYLPLSIREWMHRGRQTKPPFCLHTIRQCWFCLPANLRTNQCLAIYHLPRNVKTNWTILLCAWLGWLYKLNYITIDNIFQFQQE